MSLAIAVPEHVVSASDATIPLLAAGWLTRAIGGPADGRRSHA